jgi:hypothetical protein
MTNPYLAQQPLEAAWDHGFEYGREHPHNSTPEPPDFSSWSHFGADQLARLPDVWREGAVAGRTAALGHAPTGADSSDDGESLPGGVLTPATGAEPTGGEIRVHTVKFWVNGFIADAHVDAPPGASLAISGCEYFSGDNRGYSAEIHAPSRLHTEVEVVDCHTGHPHQSFQWSKCGESHALGSDLHVIETKEAIPEGGWSDPHYSEGVVSVHLRAGARMPLLPSPMTDVNGTFSVNIYTGEVTVAAMIDVYPWYEGYVAINNGSPIALFNEDPTGSPLTLLGDANRPVHASVHTL